MSGYFEMVVWSEVDEKLEEDLNDIDITFTPHYLILYNKFKESFAN